LNFINSNPWRDARSLTTPKAPPETRHYSLEEAETIVSALVDHPQEQLIFCLATFAGLRPGEIAGLQWSDIEESEELEIGGSTWRGWLHVRRAVVCREVGPAKTDESVASVPLLPQICSMFKAWRIQCGNPKSGWVFQNKFGAPVDLPGVVRRVIVPALKAKNLTWKSLYAGRRAAGTLLTQLTGNAVAASYVLRHKNLATTTACYIKPSREAAVIGMQLLAEKLAERQSRLKEPKALAPVPDVTE